jgi:bifunctional non-homologous end joining protein LigD
MNEGAAPTEMRPMLATPAASLPTGDEWAYEMKWDGVRALALVEGGKVRLTSRNGNDVTVAYPEIHALADQLGTIDVMLDGEIVAPDDGGRASFQRLQSRMHLRDPAEIAKIAGRVPVGFMIFDVVWIDGKLVTPVPYRDRRRLLDQLDVRGSAGQVPPTSDDGEAAFAISKNLGFEGVVAKRLDSPYESGRRSSSWRKVKHQLGQEFVVGGWVSGQGGRENSIGALMLGYYDDAGRLQYAGKVGTGFTNAELEHLAAVLGAIETTANPFPDGRAPSDAHFVQPRLVVAVRFTEWTEAGHVRQPAYLGRRDDKDPKDVRRETEK